VEKISGGGLRLPVAFRSSNKRGKRRRNFPPYPKGWEWKECDPLGRISNIAVSNGILGIECVAVNAARGHPGIAAGQVIQMLAMPDLDRKHREAMGGVIPTGKMEPSA